MMGRGMAVVGAIASAMLGLASAASADETLDGSYTRIYLSTTMSTLGHPAVVYLTPCGSGCTLWKLDDNPYPGFEMHLQGKRWVDTRGNGISHSFDKDTLIGVTRGETAGLDFTDTWMLVKNE